MFYTVLTVQLSSIVFHQATTIFDLFPFNNVRHYSPKERLKEAIFSGIAMLFPIIFLIAAFLFHLHFLVYISASLALFIFTGASLTWWPPYLFGRAFKWAAMGEDWNELYNRTFAHTIIIVPPYKNRPRPNLEHNILHLIILAESILTFIYAIYYW